MVILLAILSVLVLLTEGAVLIGAESMMIDPYDTDMEWREW